jgi:uncharacterized protein (TIGR02466 family)
LERHLFAILPAPLLFAFDEGTRFRHSLLFGFAVSDSALSMTSPNNSVDFSRATMTWLFPSPVMHFDWPDSEALNQALCEVILKRRSASPGVIKTNRGGWQSETNLQDWEEPAARELIRRIIDLTRAYCRAQTGRDVNSLLSGWKIRAWANVNEKGHFNRTHNHIGAWSFFSGVYYVNVGDIENTTALGGRTRFEDWTRVAIDIDQDTDVNRRDLIMHPKNGRMLLFPANLMHSVETYQGSAQRITIAFNLYHPDFGVPRLREAIVEADWWWTNFRGLVLLKRKIPEKLCALGLMPGLLFGHPSPVAKNASLVSRVVSAYHHATALASEKFETRNPR